MKIENVQQYVEKLLESGAKASWFKKFARVAAVQGKEGQEVVTVMKNGVEETKNVVKLDENGNAGWIVTNPDGEQYIVPHDKFVKRYEIEVGADGKHAPKGEPIMAVQIQEDVEFVAPWGEGMNIKVGGYLNISNPSDIYGIQEDEFNNTYAPCDKNGIFNDENLRKSFGQEKIREI